MISNKIWLPEVKRDVISGDIINWYNNVPIEYAQGILPDPYQEKFYDYYYEAGLLNNHFKFNFFHHHYSRPLYIAISHLFRKITTIKILDIGCGMGSQSLLFALLGAEVVGIDMDSDALEIFRLRKEFYEKLSKRPLKITTYCANAFSADYTSYGPFDGVYSLFAFNMMQPSQKLLDTICPHLNSGALFIVQDGNKNMWFNRLFRCRAVLSKEELHDKLRERGFYDVKSIGGYAMPPVLWQIFPNQILQPMDSCMVKNTLLAVSYLHMARFRG
ncbi:MAG: class I SAM-dependent methyltransferase [Candidatus Desantisbacteria bacterium]